MENPELSQRKAQTAGIWDDRPADDSPFSRILVPVDGSDVSIDACRMAVRVARAHGLAVTALYVIENEAVDKVAASSGDSRESVRRQLEDKGRRYLDHAANLADQYGVTCQGTIRQGILHNQIADVARDAGIDLIVIGDSHLQRGRHAIGGSVTERVIKYASCSVLVVRPS